MTEVMGPPAGGHDRTEPVDIQVEMQRSYIDYAMSVIVGRALPDVRDGLKPVHRRLLWAMRLLRLDPTAGYKKCARVVGDTIGKYHPHGDQSVYDALVRAIPMKRVGQPDDIPGIVAFLASDEAGFITGQVISVSGGLTMAG